MKTLYGSDLYEQIMSGAKEVYESVSSTYGPKGRTVILKTKDQQVLTKDGVTVAKFISFPDSPFKDIGCSVLKESSINTNMIAGDGTTTSVILTYNILKNSKKLLLENKTDVRTLLEEIEEVSQKINDNLSKQSKKITSIEEIKAVATISANNDEEIGGLIAEAIDSVGNNGFISIDESKSNTSSILLKEGFQFDSGFSNKLFVNSKDGRPIIRYHNPLFLITDHKLHNITPEFENILSIAHKAKKPLVIIADDVTGPAFATLLGNFQREILNSVVINLSVYGEKRTELLEDLSISLGGKFVSEKNNMDFKGFALNDFGRSKLVEIKSFQTSIVDPYGDSETLQNKIDILQEEIMEEDNLEICKAIQERITRLQSGSATILVGGTSQTEMIERKFRVEDSLEAVNSAIQGGILTGGCVALLRACNALLESHQQCLGFQVISDSITQMFEKLCENSGVNNVFEVINDIISSENIDFGYDFLKKEYGNMIEKGIIDPTIVTKTSLSNAVSSASILLTSNAALVKGDT